MEILERERHYCETKTSRSNYPKLIVFFFHRVKLVPKNEIKIDCNSNEKTKYFLGHNLFGLKSSKN